MMVEVVEVSVVKNFKSKEVVSLDGDDDANVLKNGLLGG
jgi:hypothetical protein